MGEDWSPCKLFECGKDSDTPRFGLDFCEFDDTQDYLEEQGLMGGGYTWHAIVESLMRTNHKELSKLVDYNPEGSALVAVSADLNALRAVLQCIKNAIADESVLRMALDNADADILE